MANLARAGGVALVPDSRTQARRWAATPVRVREKFEALEAQAAQLRAASTGAENAWLQAVERHEEAVDALERLERDAQRSPSSESAAEIADRRLELQRLADRRDRLHEARAPIGARSVAASQLLRACRKHLGIEE